MSTRANNLPPRVGNPPEGKQGGSTQRVLAAPSWLSWFQEPGRPSWERPALLALLLGTAVLYLWGLDRNGWANSYYSAAAMSGSQDLTAFLFGSSDPGNAITVDNRR